MTKFHIIGAGLSGLSASIYAQAKGYDVEIYEATQKAGGRCGYFIGPDGQHYDRGTHLIIKGYRDTFRYLREIGATDTLYTPANGTFNFHDAATKRNWSLTANKLGKEILLGKVPHLSTVKFLRQIFEIVCKKGDTPASHIFKPDDPATAYFWDLFCKSIFNTSLQEIPIGNLKSLFTEIAGRGADCFIPFFPKHTLHESFIAPALKRLPKVHYGHTFNALHIEGNIIKGLRFKGNYIPIESDDFVIFALPFKQVVKLNLIPSEHTFKGSAIGNFHFFLNTPLARPVFKGQVNGCGEWIWGKGHHICITISDFPPNSFDSSDFVANLWTETCEILELPRQSVPKSVKIIEKNATIRQNLTFRANRPTTRTRLKGVFLVGDWIDTKLPATIESAIRSGELAVNTALEH